MRSRTLLTLVAALAAVLVLGSLSPAFADALDDARAAGYVGEQPDGYLGVLPGAPASAQALAWDINAQRRAEYQKIATRNGTEVSAVAALAGQKLIARTKPGQYYRDGSDNWVKR